MDEFEIVYLKLANGTSPIINWLNSLDKATRTRIISRIERIHSGDFGEYKKLTEDISELKFKFGSGYRVYYHQVDKLIVLIINGGDKSTQKKDIAKSINLLEEWRINNEL